MQSIYIRPIVNKYVILFVERSGSTYLSTLLDSHPDVLGKREEFAHLRQRGVDGKGQVEWAKKFWTPPLLGRNKAIGFKTKLVDILDREEFARLLIDSRVRIIKLQRQNLVKAVVSTLNAKRLHDASGNWNLLKESDRLPAFSVDFREFERLLQKRIQWDKELEEFVSLLNISRLGVYYEDLLRDEEGFIRKILDFIGVKPKPLQGKTMKNTQDDLNKVVLNFEELRSRYEGTPYHAMFDEVLVVS